MYIGILGFLVLYQHLLLMGRLAYIILRYVPLKIVEYSRKFYFVQVLLEFCPEN